MTCYEVDRLITPFIDGLCTDAERSAIVEHLQRCYGCRTRVEAESTARHMLHAHAAVAKTIGVAPAWRPRVFRLGQPLVPVHPTLLIVPALVLVGLAALWFRPAPLLAVGVISDSYCQQDHSRLMVRGPRECTLGCVQHGAEFVLVTASRVYKIKNQQLADLPAFANLPVKVEGTMDGERITVRNMTASDAGALHSP